MYSAPKCADSTFWGSSYSPTLAAGDFFICLVNRTLIFPDFQHIHNNIYRDKQNNRTAKNKVHSAHTDNIIKKI